VLVPDVDPPEVILPPEEAHHIAHVLRLEAGDPLIVFDGAGHEWDARIVAVSKREVVVTIEQGRTPVIESATRVTLAIGLLKGSAMDDVVRDATALGVAAIVPMITAHCAIPKRARGDDAITRWERIAVASAKQCGRAMLPAFSAVTPFMDIVRMPADLRLICLEPVYPGAGPHIIPATEPYSALMLVGPEGGWSSGEVAAAKLAGFHGWQLGPLTLRAELAPTVALSQLRAALSLRDAAERTR
jgi:16S rRNA (uracil1498-N3)-methyltransferase